MPGNGYSLPGLPRRPNQRSCGLSWRAFVVRQNFSNGRRKIIDASARYDDAVTAAVSFFGDAQESPALVFPEFHVEMLALYLQFSRLDDVIHFCLRLPTLPHPFWGMEAKSAGFCANCLGPGYPGYRMAANPTPKPGSQADRHNNAIKLRCRLLNLQFRAPSYLNPTGIEEYCIVLSN